MPSLHILKGANEGTHIALDGDKFVLGRNPDCGIVIPVTSVSREPFLDATPALKDWWQRMGKLLNI